jgi:tRNA C32,U32 (ribose-2'-O)-methylase TrmJ
VFGNETSGLTNEEAGLCSLPVTIPTDAEFSSLNLGAAVQVLCYELRMAALGDPAAAPRSTRRPSRPRMPTSRVSWRTSSVRSPPAASTTRPTPSA